METECHRQTEVEVLQKEDLRLDLSGGYNRYRNGFASFKTYNFVVGKELNCYDNINQNYKRKKNQYGKGFM